MKKKIENYYLKKLDEAFLHTTETLWNNEIEANIYVAKIMLGTAGIAFVAMILNYFGIFTIDTKVMYTTCGWGIIELVVPAIICFKLKGKKKWLKVVLLVEYAIVLARLQSVLTHNITVAIVFPVVLSIRYYSKEVTIATATITTILSGLAAWAAVVLKMGVLNLNILPVPDGTVITVFNNSLRQSVYAVTNLDLNEVWKVTFKFDFLPKFLCYTLVAAICVKVADEGRKAIFSQEAETKKTERISTELNLASNIQANMLPNIFPAFPNRSDFDIYATMKPAKEVGGDFYDYFMIDSSHLALVIADVSGKGVPAAMFMVIAKTLIKDHTQLGLTPEEVFTRVNSLLCEGNESGLFVTAWMGVLDLTTGELTYVNAGHNLPVIASSGEVKFLDCKAGFVLAGMETTKYKQTKLKMNKGDKLFLYTDGITEATSLNNELYGDDRLIECLKKCKDLHVVDALRTVKSDVEDFVGKAEQFDDMTMLAFDFSEKGGKEVMEKTFDAQRHKLDDVLEFIESELEKRDCNQKTQMMIAVMVEEIFVNIASYAYPNKDGMATIGMEFEGDDVTISFRDSGVAFNPLEKEDPDITLKAEDRDIGGLGIYMVKKTMDKVTYERKANENILTIKKGIH